MIDEKARQRVQHGKEALFLLPVVEEICDAIEERIHMAAMAKVADGSHTDRDAALAWAKLHVLKEIRDELETRIRAGESAAARLTVV